MDLLLEGAYGMLNLTNMTVHRNDMHFNWSDIFMDALKLIVSMDVTHSEATIMVQFGYGLCHMKDDGFCLIWDMCSHVETNFPGDGVQERYTLNKEKIHAQC
jgi:hypothetical protein